MSFFIARILLRELLMPSKPSAGSSSMVASSTQWILILRGISLFAYTRLVSVTTWSRKPGMSLVILANCGVHNWSYQGRSIIRLSYNHIDYPGGSVHPPLALDEPQNSCK